MSGVLRALALLLLTSVPLVGCFAAKVPSTIVMAYEDFGTQVGVYEWLGFGWWQWQSEGGGDPNQHYEIKVVVYRGVSEAEVRRRYPVDPARFLDYRYISYEDAIRHLDELIAEDDVEPLTEQLKSTRERLRRHFERH